MDRADFLLVLDSRDESLVTWLRSGPTSGVLLDDVAVVSRFAEAAVLQQVASGFLLCDGRYGRGALPIPTQKVLLHPPRPGPAARARSFFVISLRPRRHSFVTVGRLDGNDVALADPRVSKFHAFFVHGQTNGAAGLRIFDAQSSNGTSVNRAPAMKRGCGEGTPVESGDSVSFGGVNTTYLVASDLHRFLRENVE
jgi:hypothetical protein